MRFALIALVACSRPVDGSPAGSPAELEAYLRSAPDVGSWRLDRAGWDRTVSPLYRPLYDDYVTAFAAEAPAIAAQLGPGPIAARKHFAGDPRLTPAEARIRWTLPVLFPSLVAERGGAPIDAVFVDDHGQWRALIGLDHALLTRIAAHDPGCAARITAARPTGRCAEAGAAVADAALRIAGPGRSPELDHACRLAEALCGKDAP